MSRKLCLNRRDVFNFAVISMDILGVKSNRVLEAGNHTLLSSFQEHAPFPRLLLMLGVLPVWSLAEI